MNQYIIIAIISTILFGINTIIQKRCTGVDPVTFTLLSSAATFISVLIYWLFFNHGKIYTPKGISLSLMSGIVSAAAFLMFIIALRNWKVSPIVIINSFSAVIAVVLSVIILSEKLTYTQIMGVILGISGVILVSI